MYRYTHIVVLNLGTATHYVAMSKWQGYYQLLQFPDVYTF